MAKKIIGVSKAKAPKAPKVKVKKADEIRRTSQRKSAKERAKEKAEKEQKKRVEKAEAYFEAHEKLISEIKDKIVTVIKNTKSSDVKVDFNMRLETDQRAKSIMVKLHMTGKINDKDLDYLKEISKPSRYKNLIRYRINVTGDNKDDVVKAKELNLTQGQLDRIAKKQAKGEEITDEQMQSLAKYTTAINESVQRIASSILPKTSDEIETYTKKFKRENNLQLGQGDSFLLNDLAYSAKAHGPQGKKVKELIEKLQSIMSDPKKFLIVENWYRYSDKGIELHKEIDSAVGQLWYEETERITVIIKDILSDINGLLEDDELEELREAFEIISNETTFTNYD